jgi:hypothetical protein
VVLAGQSGGDEGPGLSPGLDHENPEAKAREDAVAGREVPGLGSGVEGEFGEDGPGGGDFLVQLGVFGRVALGQAAADDGDGPGSGAECAPVRGRVDPPRPARDDGQARPAEDAREPLGLLNAVGGAGAGADDADGITVEPTGVEATLDVEERRRFGDRIQEGGVFGVAARDDPDREARGPFEFGINERFRIAEARADGFGRAAADAADGLETAGVARTSEAEPKAARRRAIRTGPRPGVRVRRRRSRRASEGDVCGTFGTVRALYRAGRGRNKTPRVRRIVSSRR